MGMTFAIFLQFPTHRICYSASSTPSNNNKFLSVYYGRRSHIFLQSGIIFAPSTTPATQIVCGGQSEDPLMGWYVPSSSVFTSPNHTFPCADFIVHRPYSPSTLWRSQSDRVYAKVDACSSFHLYAPISNINWQFLSRRSLLLLGVLLWTMAAIAGFFKRILSLRLYLGQIFLVSFLHFTTLSFHWYSRIAVHHHWPPAS